MTPSDNRIAQVRKVNFSMGMMISMYRRQKLTPSSLAALQISVLIDFRPASISAMAFAAPVFSTSGKLEAALSVPFLAGAEPGRMEEIRLAAIAAAEAMSEALP